LGQGGRKVSQGCFAFMQRLWSSWLFV